MTPSHRAALELASALVPHGYAADIIAEILCGDADTQAADTLFRTITLDEAWAPGDAEDLYRIAYGALHGGEDAATDIPHVNQVRARWAALARSRGNGDQKARVAR